MAGLQFDRQGKEFEVKAVRHMIVDVYVQRLSKIVLDLQSHFAPSTERQAAGHLPLHAGRGQAFEADGVDDRQCQQC
ncbi:hypothetical protein D3C86_2146060 [compost metagenome]